MPRIASPWYKETHDAWYVKIQGKLTPLGVKGRSNRDAAMAAWHRLLAGKNDKKTEAAPEGILVRELGARFLEAARKRLKPNTLNWYTRVVEGIQESLGRYPVDKVLSEDLQAWVDRASWGTTTRNHAIGVIKILFRWGFKRGFYSKDPSAILEKPPRKSRGAEMVLDPKEVRRLEKEAPEQLRDVIKALYATGARPDEIRRVEAGNIDWKEACVRFREHKTARFGEDRIIYLPPAVLPLMKSLARKYPSGKLFRNQKGRAWTKDALVLAFKRLRKKTGIRVTAYSFRHTFSTDALARGVPEAHVAELLGHRSLTMLAFHYNHVGRRARELKKSLGRIRG